MPKIVDHAARRREIAEVVARLIAGGGLEAATFRQVAHSSGYSKGVIEHYFDNKEALIGGALDWVNHCYLQRVATSTRELAGLAALRSRMEAILPLNRRVRDEWKVRMVFWSEAAITPSLRAGQAARFDLAVRMYRADLERAVALGEMAAPDDLDALAQRLFMAIIGACTLSLYNASRWNGQFLRAEVDHLLVPLAQTTKPTTKQTTTSEDNHYGSWTGG